MKIKEIIEIEKTVCDICGASNEVSFIDKCYYCGKDVCQTCARLLVPAGKQAYNSNSTCICIECLKKVDDEGCPKEHWLFGGEDE